METEAVLSAGGAPQRQRKELIGVVTSAKMQKTIVVRVTRQMQHRLYDRYVHSVTKKFYAHDEQGEARPGDTVRIVETRPAVETEALAAGGSGVAAAPVSSSDYDRGEERRGHDSDAKLADGGR